ncbi:PREDICTED: T-cell immunomodulatory protein-like [Thamnophis sirtalis]|uniref:T-cell immunomodulatory protein-like n=1 Tax=Thamnophis sirtalis TaxID=35019 RepID=A0A6I9YVT7_9SAUR|nr:PREDICTED: T-cell immunomodulatory protein-like [Thamnophis sirtalis]
MGAPCRPVLARRGRSSLLWPPLLLLVTVGALLKPVRALQNVTSQLFGAEAFGTLAAFGDFNSDKQTDLFVLRGENELNIFLADQNEPYFKPKVKLLLRDVVITSVVPGDYDGDSQMDALLTTRPQEQPDADLSIWIFWGNNQTLGRLYRRKYSLSSSTKQLRISLFSGECERQMYLNSV